MSTPPARWQSPVGAPPEILEALHASVGALPAVYLDLLRAGNGGEAGLRCRPLNLCLDPAEAALDYWRSGTCTAKAVFVFGGSGGGDLLAFDLRTPGQWPVVCFDPIDPEGSMEVVAPDLQGLLSQVEDHGPPTISNVGRQDV